jgi:excisionase family DNA binding protein
MTMPAFDEEIGARLPSADERTIAKQLCQVLAASAGNGARVTIVPEHGAAPADVVLTPSLSSLLMELLRHIGKGDAVTLVPISQQLTTQQAADILNVSRPYVISLLEQGAIPFDLVGRHRRIRAEDLFAYKQHRDARRGRALADLAAADATLL